MLNSHYKRFKAEIKTIVCVCCGDTVKDCVRWTQDGKITDSWGYTEDVDGDTCSAVTEAAALLTTSTSQRRRLTFPA